MRSASLNKYAPRCAGARVLQRFSKASRAAAAACSTSSSGRSDLGDGGSQSRIFGFEGFSTGRGIDKLAVNIQLLRSRRNAFAFAESCCSGLWAKRFMGIICSLSWFKASRALRLFRIPLSKVENQVSFHLAAINFIKGFVNIFKFSRLTFNPVFPAVPSSKVSARSTRLPRKNPLLAGTLCSPGQLAYQSWNFVDDFQRLRMAGESTATAQACLSE